MKRARDRVRAVFVLVLGVVGTHQVELVRWRVVAAVLVPVEPVRLLMRLHLIVRAREAIRGMVVVGEGSVVAVFEWLRQRGQRVVENDDIPLRPLR